jgi:site-specific recombinase XerD
MADQDDEDQGIIEVVPGAALGSLLPQTKIEDVWDVALAGSISDQSRRSYFQGMIGFARFILDKASRPVPKNNQAALEQAAPFLPHVRFPLVTEYRDSLRDQKYAASTVNVRLAALDMLFKRMMRLELIDQNPASAELVRRLKVSNISEAEALTHEEAENLARMLNEDESLAGIRDLALFSVFIYNGLRRAEIIQIDLDNIKYVGSTPTIHLIIKRGKHLSIEFIPTVWKMVDRWLVAANIQSGPIFRRIRKSTGNTQKVTEERLTPNGIYDIIGRRIKQAGITKNIHPHSLRHTYATFSLLAGVPIQEVQKSMGHSSIDTTSRYDRAIEQVGRSPGRSISLNWPGSQKHSRGKNR